MMSTNGNESSKNVNKNKHNNTNTNNTTNNFGHHSAHSKTLPAIDLANNRWTLPTAKPLSLSYNNSFSTTATSTTQTTIRANDLKLNLSLESQSDTDNSQSFQTITSLPNLPTLNLNDSKTSEEHILCTVPIINNKIKTKPKLLLREAAKSEPPMPSIPYTYNRHRNQHTLSKSLHQNTIPNIKHITSQPPPMPLYIHNKQRVHFHKSINSSNNNNYNFKPSKSVPPNINKNKSNKNNICIKNKNKKKDNNKKEVIVMRDKEVLQMDEEIPIEKFIDALQKGYARIMTENEQNEEYKKSARIARSVSVGNMQAYKDEILLEQKQKRTRTRIRKRKLKKKKRKNRKHKLHSQSNKNTPKTHKRNGNNMKPKSKPISNRFEYDINNSSDSLTDTDTESDSNSSDSSSSLHLLDPPNEIKTARQIIIKPSKRKMKIKRSTTADNSSNNDTKNNTNKNKIKGLRIRSKTMQSQRKKNESNNNQSVKRNRQRPNAHYRNNMPTSPTIPEEDDILDMLSVNEVIDDTISTHSGNSSCGFSSDSDSDNTSSNTDHECEVNETNIPSKSPNLVNSAKSCDTITSGLSFETPKFKIIKQNENSYSNSDSDHEDSINKLLFNDNNSINLYDDVNINNEDIISIDSGNHLNTNMYTKIEHNQSNPLQLPIVDELRQRSLSNSNNNNTIAVPITRERTLSNESMFSNSSSGSSSNSSSASSSSSDWDEEVREEEAQAQRLINGDSDSDSDDTVTDTHSELATSSDSDEYKNEDTKSFSLEQSNSSTVKLKHIYESHSDCDSENDIAINYNNNKICNDNMYFPARPQSTPFRSSKGTAVFLSHLKSYRNDELRRSNISGNLNELINGASKVYTNKNKNKNISQQNHSQFIPPIKTIKPVTINDKNKINNKFIDSPSEYNSPIPIKMKKKRKKTRKAEK